MGGSRHRCHCERNGAGASEIREKALAKLWAENAVQYNSNAVILNLAIAANVFYIAGSYLGAILAIKNGAKIIRPIMFCVVDLLIIKLIVDLIV